MITFYAGKRKDQSCRKAEIWLKAHHISYRKICSQDITTDVIYNMLYLSENGFDDILLSKSRGNKKWNEVGLNLINKLNSMPIRYLVELLEKKPQLLKAPILFDEKNLVSGYREDEIRVFIPRSQRFV